MHVFVMGACACLFIIEDMRYSLLYFISGVWFLFILLVHDWIIIFEIPLVRRFGIESFPLS